MAAAVIGALAASACCLGPLVVGVLGLGGLTGFAALQAYRPYFLLGTGVMLAVGFWLTYRRPVPTTQRARLDACGCERTPSPRASRVTLWTVSGLVTVFAASPYAMAVAGRGSAQATRVAGDAVTIFVVDDLECDSCAPPIRSAVQRVGGVGRVEVDVERHRVTVSHASGPGLVARYQDAINQLGYHARVADR